MTTKNISYQCLKQVKKIVSFFLPKSRIQSLDWEYKADDGSVKKIKTGTSEAPWTLTEKGELVRVKT